MQLRENHDFRRFCPIYRTLNVASKSQIFFYGKKIAKCIYPEPRIRIRKIPGVYIMQNTMVVRGDMADIAKIYDQGRINEKVKKEL